MGKVLVRWQYTYTCRAIEDEENAVQVSIFYAKIEV